MTIYGYALGAEGVHTFTSLSAKKWKNLLRLLGRLARQPHQRRGYQEAGASDRIYEVMLSGELLLTWWGDHAG